VAFGVGGGDELACGIGDAGFFAAICMEGGGGLRVAGGRGAAAGCWTARSGIGGVFKAGDAPKRAGAADPAMSILWNQNPCHNSGERAANVNLLHLISFLLISNCDLTFYVFG
jgi:hypothetical protein